MSEPGARSGGRARIVASALLLSVALGLWLRWPAVHGGYRDDDYVQLAMLQHEFVLKRPFWDLFWFAGGSRAEELALIDFGYHPWWAQPGLRLSMFRPLSSLLITFDVWLFGADPTPAHVHSFVWWLALMGSVTLLLTRLLPPWTAALAVLLFSLEEAHGVPLCWLANRSTLVATSFTLLGVYFHVRWRRDAWRPGRVAAPLCLALGLAAGEYALTTFAYLVCFEALGMHDAWPRRLRAAAPALGLAGAYLALRALLGHGVQGSGFYISPSAEPLSFLVAAAQRVPVLVGDLLFGVPAGWWVGGSPWRGQLLQTEWFDAATWRQLPSWHFWHWLIGLSALFVGGLLLRAARRREPAGLWLELRWLCGGALLSLLPAAGSLPSDRLLTAASVAVAALSAVVVVAAGKRLLDALAQRRPRVALASLTLLCCVAFLQVAQAGLRSAQEADSVGGRSAALRRWSLNAEIPAAPAGQLRVVLLQAADFTTAANLPWVRLAHGLPLPRYYRRLSGAFQAHDLERISDRTLEVRALSNQLHDSAAGTLYRSLDATFVDGQRIGLPGMQVELVRTLDGNPFQTRFHFDLSLDSPDFVLLYSGRVGLIRIPVPAIGQRIRLPRASYPSY